MKLYKCDNCQREFLCQPSIEVKGKVLQQTKQSGGILLPDNPNSYELQFCGACCFWEWIGKHKHEKL